MEEIDLASLRETALRLARSVEGYGRRDFLKKVKPGKEPRIKVLRGFRGLGKTTALLQMMDEGSLYFSMDNPYVEMFSLYEIGKKAASSGYSQLLIDEVHHYRNWKKETKALYDEFPRLSIAVSGSAPLAFEPERRYEIIEVEPLSLSEFMRLGGKGSHRMEEWEDEGKVVEFLSRCPEAYPEYGKYLGGGAFPTYFSYGEKTLGSIYNSIRKSIREDAVFLPKVDGEVVSAMERAAIFIATSSLGEFSINGLSKTLGINKYRAYHTVSLLSEMKIFRLVRPRGRGAKLVRGEPKLMFRHPCLREAVCEKLGMKADVGALREEMAVFCLEERGWSVKTIRGMKRSPDYVISRGDEKIVVEIGGESKGASQLSGFGGKKMLLKERQLVALGCF